MAPQSTLACSILVVLNALAFQGVDEFASAGSCYPFPMKTNIGMRSIEALCWVFFACCAIGISRYLVLDLLCWLNWGTPDWGTWIGAIGTVGTLIGTIWLATQQAREKRAQDLIEARLTAHEKYFQYIHDEGNIAAAIGMLRLALGPEVSALGQIERVHSLMDLATDRLDKVQLQAARDIMPLTILPGDCARRIAAAQGRVESTRKILREAKRGLTDFIALQVHLQSNLDILEVALAQMKQVMEILNHVVDTGPSRWQEP